MLQNVITEKKNKWLQSPECTINSIIDYILAKGQLRGTQIEAIETYLYLKIAGRNQPLWQLFSDGFFTVTETDLSKANINQEARDVLEANAAARALYEYATQKVNGKEQLSDLKKLIIENPSDFDYERVIKAIFYGITYPDYLFSLPMGAGKTYLMAAFIYLDLYFAANEPENKSFAHNFLVLVPSGLKSSIMPSLKSIENFDPTWILPEPAAGEIKSILKFEVLDQTKSAKKSNKARNPNAQKVNQYLAHPDLTGLVLVVNAEKVILDRLEITDQLKVIERTDDEQDKFANELRNLIGKIPNLEIMIDEVHHAATDDIKLRQVVNKWHGKGKVTTVMGFSGTPYISKADKIPIGEGVNFKFSQITNTIYYYPLISGIKAFLKKPTVKIAQGLESLIIIERGLTEFYEQYGKMKYSNGCIPKIAIYCGKIERLETEVYPFIAQLITKFGDTDANILKFHKGNKDFKLPKENELEYNSLDLPLSKKRVILLVQVGKEGWDCQSLTGIILAQKGDSPRNMVLQTSCRCLREVEKGKDETALIWLNEYNAKTLNAQLKEEQHSSIEELNKIGKEKEPELVERFPRIEHLNLPSVELYQMKIEYHTLTVEDEPHTGKKLVTLLKGLDSYKSSAVVRTKKNFMEDVAGGTAILDTAGYEVAVYDRWLADLSKQSFNFISILSLKSFDESLQKVFKALTYKPNGHTVYNDRFDLDAVNVQIRIAFSAKRSLEIKEETVRQKAELLLIDKLGPSKKNKNIYPEEQDVQKILDLDKSGRPTSINDAELQKAYDITVKQLEEQGMGAMMQSFEQYKAQLEYSVPVEEKDKTFHYIPYNFWQSGFELNMLKETLMLEDFKNRKLEIYYNGERGLTGFIINCFAKNGNGWKPIGAYTPDFLIVKRKGEDLHKILIIETKGSGFAEQRAFQLRKKYVSTEFLKLNNEKFGYMRFEFLYLLDSDGESANLTKLKQILKNFF